MEAKKKTRKRRRVIVTVEVPKANPREMTPVEKAEARLLKRAEKQQLATPGAKKVVGRPFPKGVSGNPGGRKPGASITALIGKYASNEEVARVAAVMILSGNVPILQDYLNRTEGKPIERQQVRHMTGFEELDSLTDEELAEGIAVLRTITPALKSDGAVSANKNGKKKSH
jgi:hypothetical protein